VSRTYWSLVTAAENARVLQESVKRLDAHLDVVRAQLQAGIVPPNDVLIVEAQRSRQQVAYIEAANTRAVIEADLRRLTGLDPGTAIEPVEALPVPPSGTTVTSAAAVGTQPAPAGSLNLFIEQARTLRPERQALLERAQVQAARVDAAEAGKKPTIAIAGGIDIAHPNQRIVPRRDHTDGTWDVSVNLSWPIWDGGRADAEKAEASALERAARARIAEFDSVLGVEITQRRLDLDAAVASVSAASDGVRSAAEARRVVLERFSAGVATSVDLLDAQVALLQAELDRTRTLANVQIAQARLDRALGR
jgi:outer membrane protein TolC